MTISLAALLSSAEMAVNLGFSPFQSRSGLMDGGVLWNLSVVLMPFPIVGFIILVLYRGK